jgi:DNA repair exonuclease SbcCD ATPase subunit
MNKFVKVLSTGFLVILLTGMFLFAFPTSTAHAEGLDDNPPGNAEKLGLVKQRIEAAFERQQANLVRQAQNIQRLNQLSAKAQDRIDALKEKGKDVSSLEAALTAFESSITGINTSHQVADDLIDTHAGFGNNGKVVDIQIAGSTVKSIHEALKSTQQMMIIAAKELRQAIRNFRDTNSPNPTIEP